METSKKTKTLTLYKNNVAIKTPYYDYLFAQLLKQSELYNACKALRMANIRIDAQFALYSKCPEYFLLYEPKVRVNATEEEIEQAKKNLIKARYPKFYEEVFEKED